MSSFLRDILSKGRIWESVDQRVLEQQAKREDAIEKLLARQEDTAALVRSLVEQVDLYPYLYLMFVLLDWIFCICVSSLQVEELRQQGKGIQRQLVANQEE